jgi:hypothetical protein
MRIWILLLCFLLLAASACCGPAAELVPVYVEKTPVEIMGGYMLGKPSSSGLRLYGKQYPCYDDPKATCYPTIVEQSIVKIGWNQDYIIVERHPREAVIFATPDARNPTWAIIAVASGAVYRDLSYEELTEHLETLHIPHIGMQDAMDVYKQRKLTNPSSETKHGSLSWAAGLILQGWCLGGA